MHLSKWYRDLAPVSFIWWIHIFSDSAQDHWCWHVLWFSQYRIEHRQLYKLKYHVLNSYLGCRVRDSVPIQNSSRPPWCTPVSKSMILFPKNSHVAFHNIIRHNWNQKEIHIWLLTFWKTSLTMETCFLDLDCLAHCFTTLFSSKIHNACIKNVHLGIVSHQLKKCQLSICEITIKKLSAQLHLFLFKAIKLASYNHSHTFMGNLLFSSRSTRFEILSFYLTK